LGDGGTEVVPGGCDAPEVYTDPWGTGMYMTVGMGSDNCPGTRSLWWSADGKDWVMRQSLRGGRPNIMTSTENGNVYVLEQNNTTTRVSDVYVQQYTSHGTTAGKVISMPQLPLVWPTEPTTAHIQEKGGFYISRVGSYVDKTDP